MEIAIHACEARNPPIGRRMHRHHLLIESIAPERSSICRDTPSIFFFQRAESTVEPVPHPINSLFDLVAVEDIHADHGSRTRPG